MITKGQMVQFKAEWQDLGDEFIQFVAIQNENGGRVLIEAQLGLSFNPQQIVNTFMISGE